MKKYLFVAVAIVCSIAAGYSQKNIPINVQKAFSQMFPNAQKVSWDKENAHEYEAEFISNGKKQSVNFDDLGNWLESEKTITFDALPTKVAAAFTTSHKKVKVKAVAEITTSKNEIKYEIEVKKGLKNVEYFYDSEGKNLK